MFYWPNIQKFQCWKEKPDEGKSVEEEGEEVEVTCKLLKNIIWFPENFILNKYLELLEVQKGIGRRRQGRGRWS